MDDVSTNKLAALALLDDEMGGTLLMMISYALEPEMIEQIEDASALVAMYDDEVAEVDRLIERQGFH